MAYKYGSNYASHLMDNALRQLASGVFQEASIQTEYDMRRYYGPDTAINSNTRAKHKFHRINRVVEVEDGMSFEEPLDELRLKTARWLNR